MFLLPLSKECIVHFGHGRKEQNKSNKQLWQEQSEGSGQQVHSARGGKENAVALAAAVQYMHNI